MKYIKSALAIFAGLACFALPSTLLAQTDASELAKKLSNPVAALISVPMQFNFDQNIGADDDGSRLTLNIQPVIPMDINEDWNLISRTILPVTNQHNIFAGAGTQTGIGDIVQSVFFSPKKPTDSGWIWGVGPVFLLPTGSDDLLTADKWGAGPTAVMLRQSHGWTYGALVNHIWSFAGDSDRADVNSTFLQPFLAFTTPEAITYSFNTESTYNWEIDKWSVPVNVSVSKLTHFGKQAVSFQGGLRYWLTTPESGPEGLGFRFSVTLLFPK